MNVKHPDRLYKSARLNYIVNRLRASQDITPTMLATELQVSERTIYRDLSNLQKGNTLKKRYSRREGRYMLETEFQLPPLSLTPSEALALFTAASNPALNKDNLYADDLRSSLAKLTLLLVPESDSDSSFEPAEFLPGYAVVGGPLIVTAESIQRPAMEMIRRAIASNRKLSFDYWSRGSERAEAILVNPYDLRSVRNDWYLLAQAERGREARIFKVGRMRAVEIHDDRFRFPRRFAADFWFARAFEAFGASEDAIAVRVRFSASVAAAVLDNRGHRLSYMLTEEDGSVICTVHVNSIREIIWWILSYGADAEVIEPDDFRAECRNIAQTMAKLYASSSPEENS